MMWLDRMLARAHTLISEVPRPVKIAVFLLILPLAFIACVCIAS